MIIRLWADNGVLLGQWDSGAPIPGELASREFPKPYRLDLNGKYIPLPDGDLYAQILMTLQREVPESEMSRDYGDYTRLDTRLVQAITAAVVAELNKSAFRIRLQTSDGQILLERIFHP